MMSITSRAMLVVATVEVICPKCGEPIPEPISGSMAWEPSDIKYRAGLKDEGTDSAPMCVACGCFVSVAYPQTVKMGGAR